MIIKRFNPDCKKSGETVFYIQSHGLNAGRPLKKPIPNSWEIEINNNKAFEICFVVFNSKILNNYLRGSVIPFLSLHEYKKIISPYLLKPILEDAVNQKINAISKIDAALEELEQRKDLYKQLKNALSFEILKNINATL
jgi:hypothetical protein